MNVYQDVNITGELTAQTIDAQALGDNLKTALKTFLLDAVYPLNTVYTANGETSPAEFLGGTWNRIKGVFLLAADDTTYVLGGSGGSADAVVVSHKHTYMTLKSTQVGTGYSSPATSNENQGIIYNETSEVGESGVGKNMPPYKVVYKWERVSEAN